MEKVTCTNCQHRQRLFTPTLKKLQSYSHRIIRCSMCHARIRLLWRNGHVKKDY